MMRNEPPTGAALAVLVALMAFGGPLDAQVPSFERSTHLSVGYVANVPDQFLGISVMTVGPAWRGWGLYADFKQSTDSPADDPTFEAGTTASDAQLAGAEFTNESDWTTFNIALVRALTPDFALYAGGGYSKRTVYREFQRNPGLDGSPFFWIRDDGVQQDHMNLTGGAFLRVIGPFIFQIGFETAPGGATAGVAVAFLFGG